MTEGSITEGLRQRLQDHVPVLVYDSKEAFWAGDPGTFVENTFDAGPGAEYRSQLMHGGDTRNPIAKAGGEGKQKLDLDYLGEDPYPNGYSQTEEDLLDAGSEWVADARRAHHATGSRIFGRVASTDDGHWLQYWFFYFASMRSAVSAIRMADGMLGEGLHLGDWEMIQLHIADEDASIDRATFAAHAYAIGTNDPMNDLRWEKPGVPKVYVGLNSHASYPRPGQWRNLGARKAISWIDYFDDRCDADSGRDPSRPDLVEMSEENTPWVSWPGRWGKKGPRSPARQAHWSDPDGFHKGAYSIEDGLRSERLIESDSVPPSAPVVQVAQEDDKVTLTFMVPEGFDHDWAGTLSLGFQDPDRELTGRFVYDVSEVGEARVVGEG
jgi:hypothetical protein